MVASFRFTPPKVLNILKRRDAALAKDGDDDAHCSRRTSNASLVTLASLSSTLATSQPPSYSSTIAEKTSASKPCPSKAGETCRPLGKKVDQHQSRSPSTLSMKMQKELDRAKLEEARKELSWSTSLCESRLDAIEFYSAGRQAILSSYSKLFEYAG